MRSLPPFGAWVNDMSEEEWTEFQRAHAAHLADPEHVAPVLTVDTRDEWTAWIEAHWSAAEVKP